MAKIPKTNAKLIEDWRRGIAVDNTRTSPSTNTPYVKKNTTSEMIYQPAPGKLDFSTGKPIVKRSGIGKNIQNPDAERGLRIVSPEFELLSMGGGFGAMAAAKQVAKNTAIKNTVGRRAAQSIANNDARAAINIVDEVEPAIDQGLRSVGENPFGGFNVDELSDYDLADMITPLRSPSRTRSRYANEDYSDINIPRQPEINYRELFASTDYSGSISDFIRPQGLREKAKSLPLKLAEAKQTGTLSPKSIWHNNIKNRLSIDSDRHALFGKDVAGVSKFVDNIKKNIPKGGIFRDKSLSTDSYRLMLPKLSAMKDDLNVIHTGRFNPLNNYGKKKTFLNGVYGDSETNDKIIEKLSAYTERYNRNTGWKIPMPKLINNRVYIPDIIAQKKGGSIVQELKRHEVARDLGIIGSGVGAVGYGANKIIKNSKEKKDQRAMKYESKLSNSK